MITDYMHKFLEDEYIKCRRHFLKGGTAKTLTEKGITEDEAFIAYLIGMYKGMNPELI